MIKNFLLLSSLFLIGITAHSQNFYVNVEGGYGWGLPSSTIGTEYFNDQKTANGKNFYNENLYGTLGSGLNLKITPGYMFNKHIGIELGINYFKGSKVVLKKTISTDPDFLDQQTVNSNQLRVIPTVVLSTGGEKLYGYAKFGLVLPVMGKVHAVNDHKDPNNPIPAAQVDLLRVKATVEGNPSLGFYGALGIGYHITKLIGIHLEAFHTSLSVKPKSMTWDSYSVNGKEEIGKQSVYSTHTNYVDKITASSNNGDYLNGAYIPGMGSFDKDKPKDELPQKSSFDQFGLMLGISFTF